MNKTNPYNHRLFASLAAAFLLAGGLAQSVAAASEASEPAQSADTAAAKSAIRINAGAADVHTDAENATWLADDGFDGGDIVDRGDIEIANTKIPSIYRTEHYDMEKFSRKVPNGKYVVKLHFAETYEGIDGPWQRVFSFDVEGREFKDFDVWAKAGGPNRAYVETVEVAVEDGSLDIVFVRDLDNAEINGIEIIPES